MRYCDTASTMAARNAWISGSSRLSNGPSVCVPPRTDWSRYAALRDMKRAQHVGERIERRQAIGKIENRNERVAGVEPIRSRVADQTPSDRSIWPELLGPRSVKLAVDEGDRLLGLAGPDQVTDMPKRNRVAVGRRHRFEQPIGPVGLVELGCGDRFERRYQRLRQARTPSTGNRCLERREILLAEREVEKARP